MTGIKLTLSPQPSATLVANITAIGIAWVAAVLYLVVYAWLNPVTAVDLAIHAIPALALGIPLRLMLRRASRTENAHVDSMRAMVTGLEKHYGVSLTPGVDGLDEAGTTKVTALTSEHTLEHLTLHNDGERVTLFHADGPSRGSEFPAAI